MEETEEEDALLEPEPMPDVSRDESDVDSQNWGKKMCRQVQLWVAGFQDGFLYHLSF